MRFRKAVHAVLEAQPGTATGLARVVSVSLLALIAANVVAVILESVQSLKAMAPGAFDAFEWFSVAIFSVEYALRVWSCVEDERYRRAVVGRLRFALSPMALVDLAAIAPAFLPAVLPMDLRMLRGLRLFRLARIFKVARYSDALAVLGGVLRAKASELLITAMAGLLLLVLASSAMFYAENEAQPETFSSIPASMWWGVVTLTTVGYGDIYPITPVGKVLGGVIGLMGIGLFALPAGILAGGFAEELRRRRADPVVCPHCGRELG